MNKKREIPEGDEWLLGILEDLMEKSQEDGPKGEEEIIKEALYVLCVSR